MHPEATDTNSIVTSRNEYVYYPPSYWHEKDFEKKADGVYWRG